LLAYVIPVDGPYQINCDGQSGGCFCWNDYGLKLNFPSKCSQQHIQVTMSTFLPIQSELHPGVHIVSAVYQFHCNIKKFDKAFTLHLQHCIELQSPKDCHKMCFIIQHDGSNDMKYGHFEARNSYGTVNLNKFCNVFIVWISELWRIIRTIILLPLSDQDRPSLQLSSNNPNSSSSEEHPEEPSAAQNTLTQSASGQQHDPSVPPGSSTDDLVTSYGMKGNELFPD